MLKPFSRRSSQNQTQDELQGRIGRTFDQITACPLLDGVLLEDKALTGGADTTLVHGLRRTPRGWFLVNCGTGIAPGITRTSWDTTTIVLQAPSDMTVTIWVF
jgi:hypothetical protein